MAKSLRRRSESNIYHTYARGHGKQALFLEDKDRYYFLRLLRESKELNQVEVLAYCLMSNHFHLLIKDRYFQVSDFMKHFEQYYGQYFNKKNDSVGQVFQGRFKSKPVDSEAYFFSVFPYILRNPEEAGIARHNRYKWSSYGEYVPSARIPGSPREITDTRFALSVYGGERRLASAVARLPRLEKHEHVIIGRDPLSRLDDSTAASIVKNLLGMETLTAIKALGVVERNSILRQLKETGFSNAQIARLSGISKSSVQRA